MQITVNVQLSKGEAVNWTMSLDESADAVLKALGGDEDVDHCTVNMLIPEPGTAGTLPGPPVPFFMEQMPPPTG